jgi:hypothetical protein
MDLDMSLLPGVLAQSDEYPSSVFDPTAQVGLVVAHHVAEVKALYKGNPPFDGASRSRWPFVDQCDDGYLRHLFPGQDEALAAALDDLRPQSATSRPRSGGQVINMPSERGK